MVRSQTTVVSRWLAIPTAARSRGVISAEESASLTTASTLSRISTGSCSTQPGRGRIWRNSRWAVATTLPALSKIMNLVLVVPWSMAPTVPLFLIPLKQ